MKVLMITTSYPDHSGSQRGIFIRKLCLELIKEGLDVVVLTPRVLSSSPFHEFDSGIDVYRFWYPSMNTQLNQMDSIPVLSMVIYMISGIIMGLRTIWKEKPDIIHGNWIVPTGLIASIIGRITSRPIVNTARGMDVRVSKNRAVKMLFDLAVKLSNKVTVVSPAMKSVKGIEDAEVISSGVDPIFFDIASDPSSKTVLYTRSLEQVYDAATLLKSIPIILRTIPDIKIIIAGTGSQEKDLKSLAHELRISDQVTFLGHVAHNTIVDLTSGASVFVSTATADGTSIALLEAMAAGLTPVATDITANRELIIHEKDGYLFRPGDEEDLAHNIIRALSHEIAPQMLKEKREFLEDKICWSTVANRFINSYSQLLMGSRRQKK
jgi:L-malate glycosyltransferase